MRFNGLRYDGGRLRRSWSWRRSASRLAATTTTAQAPPAAATSRRARASAPARASRADEAKAAGEQAAEEAGGKAELPTGKTIGIINFLDGIESSDRLASTTEEAAEGARLGDRAL